MGVISIAVPSTDSWYFSELLRGTTQRIEAAGHTANVHVIAPSPTSTLEAATVIEEDFDRLDSIGAIAAGFKYRATSTSRPLAWKRPAVVIGGSVLGFPTVMIDDIGAARQATSHLIDLGHRRITHFTGSLDLQADFLIFSRRVKGYRTTMESAGLDPVVVENDFDPAAVRRSALEVLQRPSRPTAVFAATDEIAYAVLAAARDLGLRPGQDLSVIGIDDHPGAEGEGLTTLRQQPAEMGATAAEMLLGGLSAGPDPKQSRLHPITLVKRTSTGRLRTA